MASTAELHLTRQNSFVKSMYLKDRLEGTLGKGYHYRIDGGSLYGVKGEENAIYVFDGSVTGANLSNSLLSIEGGSVKELTAKNCRVAIRSGKQEWAQGGKVSVVESFFQNCEVDIFDAEISKTRFKSCRVNMFNSKASGLLEVRGKELYLHSTKVDGDVIVEKCRGEWTDVGIKGAVFLKECDIGVKKGLFQNPKGVCLYLNKTSFRADESAFQSLYKPGCIVAIPGHVRLRECIVKAIEGYGISLDDENSSLTMIKGMLTSAKGDALQVSNRAKAYLKAVDTVSANSGVGISVSNKGVVIADLVTNIYGKVSAVTSTDIGSMCYLVACQSVSSGGDDVVGLQNGGWCVVKGGVEMGAITRVVGGEGGFTTLRLTERRYEEVPELKP
jgi:hypothetical protein